MQGIHSAVVLLFIFNHSRKKSVIKACLPQSPPCLRVFQPFEKKKMELFLTAKCSPEHIRSDSAPIAPQFLLDNVFPLSSFLCEGTEPLERALQVPKSDQSWKHSVCSQFSLHL